MANPEHLAALKKGVRYWNQWRENHPDIKNPDLSEEERCLPGLSLHEANLSGVDFSFSNLDGVNFHTADLRDAAFTGAKFRRAEFIGADLRGAGFELVELAGIFQHSIVDGHTLIRNCKVTQEADFRGVGLDSARIDSDIKYLLKYNIRRMNWEDWYDNHRFSQWLVRAFLWMSDYGRSPFRIVITFLGTSLLFSIIYSLFPDTVQGLKEPVIVTPFGIIPSETVGFWDLFSRAFYFSIVTMTTLGFGDMYATPGNYLGYGLLMVHVVIGYVILGALITYLGILFTAEGPSGEFGENRRMDEILGK